MRIAKAYKNMIEFELRNYDYTLEIIEGIKDEIINKPPMAVGETERVMDSRISNPTERKGLRLVTNTALDHMERTVKAIDRALESLEEEHREIFKLHYRGKRDWRQVLSMMYISQDTFYRKRNELIEQVAIELGLVVPEGVES